MTHDIQPVSLHTHDGVRNISCACASADSHPAGHQNRFIRSFLFYVPYVTLSVMTFPAILEATQSPVSAAIALVVGIALAWRGASLFLVSVLGCAAVLIVEFFI